ncbi:MAG: SEC-C metal-binding domain-containing protein [Planctomycetia bacterium]|nr:SEC-C metal-binding domain-containing protein [Planctomycetia bacterium]
METIEKIWDTVTYSLGGLARGFERSVTSLFGSSNARLLRKLHPKVEAISALEEKYQGMSDEQLRGQTVDFRRRLASGESLDDLLVEAFAVCREGGRRYLRMRHYDTQMLGGMVLHGGNIAEMVTGEGKTLVATLPAYLNALESKGVHVVTVNDYLARRDMEWMGPLYMGLGLTVGAIYANMDPVEKQRAYLCDITYGTNNEFGFDYLRDNMKPARRGDDKYPKHLQQVQGPLNYAIVDEVDNILIDEARTPLIISGPAHDDVTRYARADKIARQLKRDVHFEVKEKEHSAHLTDVGVREAEKLAGVESFYTAGNMEWPHLIDNSLKAHHLYKLDVNYVVQGEEIVIVDEFTGRLMPGRNWSDGLHQAVEAKEGVRIKEENQTLATITLQNFFKLYNKISGMTGTAMTEAAEFWKIYELEVVAIPTNRPMQRKNNQDVVYRTEREKFNAIVEEIERLHKWDSVILSSEETINGEIVDENDQAVTIVPHDSKEKQTIERKKIVETQRRGRPILVGTVSIEKSERLSSQLERRGVKHEVLNAKHHQREAEIVAQAGRQGAVTIATNMAGRGTDIILGGNPDTMAWAVLQDKYPTRLEVPKEEWEALVKEIDEREGMKPEGVVVKGLGGLHIIGTERHEARRIDLQLRGRCGRQGDPGSSRFFLSLEDDLMRIFAGEWVKNVLTRLGMQEGEAIVSKLVTRRIEGAQKKVEERNFDIRKNLLEYDEVMDEQRKRVYGFRQRILGGANCKEIIMEMIDKQIDEHMGLMLSKDYGPESYAKAVGERLSTELEARDFRGLDAGMAESYAKEQAERGAEGHLHDAIEENLPKEEDQADWNWEALTKWVNNRWGLNLRDRELRSIERDQLDEMILEKARAAIREVDLSDFAKCLDPDFSYRVACGWVQHKFGMPLGLDEVKDLEPAGFEALVRQRAAEAYREREIEYPVMVGLYYFTKRDAQGQKRYDRDQLVVWAKQQFEADVDPATLQGHGHQELMPALIDLSRKYIAGYEPAIAAVRERVERLFGRQSGNTTAQAASGGNGALDSLTHWLEESLACKLSREEIAGLTRDELEARLLLAVDDRFRPQMQKMERALVLSILDQAWKEHLLSMDHLRSSVGLRGYAQVDPKVEFKREGMRVFEQMWKGVATRVTDLVFRMEQLDENFVSSTWTGGKAIHQAAQSTTELAKQEQQNNSSNNAADAGEPAKSEPIRNRAQTVGRNDPCPCGSGKKFKNCCMHKGQNVA